MTEPRSEQQHHLIAKLKERRERHRRRSRIYRSVVVAVGVLITLAGLVMTGPVPGPGFLIIPVGLALLALEFVWAERLLVKAVVQAERARAKAASRSRGQKLAAAVAAALVVAAAVVAAIRWDIPYLPV